MKLPKRPRRILKGERARPEIRRSPEKRRRPSQIRAGLIHDVDPATLALALAHRKDARPDRRHPPDGIHGPGASETRTTTQEPTQEDS